MWGAILTQKFHYPVIPAQAGIQQEEHSAKRTKQNF
jgi:hypothetical protein